MLINNRNLIIYLIFCLFLAFPVLSHANAEADAAAEMARKAQDPLEDIKAIMTDNTVAFNGGPNKDTSYGFQIQPVYAVLNDSGYNQIARAIIPVVGVEPGVQLPPLGSDPRPEDGSDFGLSDTIIQYFLSPKADSGIK
jgi:hypothetical protein